MRQGIIFNWSRTIIPKKNSKIDIVIYTVSAGFFPYSVAADLQSAADIDSKHRSHSTLCSNCNCRESGTNQRTQGDSSFFLYTYTAFLQVRAKYVYTACYIRCVHLSSESSLFERILARAERKAGRAQHSKRLCGASSGRNKCGRTDHRIKGAGWAEIFVPCTVVLVGSLRHRCHHLLLWKKNSTSRGLTPQLLDLLFHTHATYVWKRRSNSCREGLCYRIFFSSTVVCSVVYSRRGHLLDPSMALSLTHCLF